MIFYEDTTIEDALKTFEDFYAKKDFKSALQVLQDNRGELPEGILNYNLGTVHAKLGNWAKARYHFLLAREGGFSSSDLASSEMVVEEKLELSRLESPTAASDYLVRSALFAKDGVLTLIALLVLLLGLLTLRKEATPGKVAFWGLLVLLPLGLSFWIDTWPRYVAVSPVSITEGPSAIFRETGELPSGVQVILMGDGDWKKVIYPDRFSGWVKAQGLERLE